MDKIKVGIMTFWGPTNYGAFLQAYALSNALNNEVGIEAELINFRMQKEVDNYLRLVHFEKNIPKVLFNIKRKKMFENCRELLTLSNGEVISDVIEDFIKYVHGKYDVIVAGSDEIWKIDGMRGFPTPYFLLGDLKCRKMSYAASGRTSFMTLDNISKK